MFPFRGTRFVTLSFLLLLWQISTSPNPLHTDDSHLEDPPGTGEVSFTPYSEDEGFAELHDQQVPEEREPDSGSSSSSQKRREKV